MTRSSAGSSATNSFCAKTWLPVVMTSAPAARSSATSLAVRPKPPAAFSPLRMVRSASSSRFSPGRIALTASRPGWPTTSATNRMRKSSATTRLSGKKKGEPDLGPPFDWLFGVLDGPRLADHRDPDLPGKAQLSLDAFGDVSRHQLGSGVIDLLRLDQDPDLAAGLDGVGLLGSLERVGNLLQLFQPLDVGLERLTPCAWAGRRDGVRGDEEKGFHRVRLFVVVVSANRVHHRSRHPMSLQ